MALRAHPGAPAKVALAVPTLIYNLVTMDQEALQGHKDHVSSPQGVHNQVVNGFLK